VFRDFTLSLVGGGLQRPERSLHQTLNARRFSPIVHGFSRFLVKNRENLLKMRYVNEKECQTPNHTGLSYGEEKSNQIAFIAIFQKAKKIV
jgi:hypothetical protein